MTTAPSPVTPPAQAQKAMLHHRHPRLHRQQRRRLHTQFTVSSAATNGTASINATTGAWSYEPDADFNGSDSFTVTVTDDDGHEETQTISLTLSAVNDDGSFSGDTSGSGAEGASITGTLAFTDSKDGDSTPNFTVSSAATNGTASINATTGAWSYEPDADFNGSDSFTVTVTDDDGHEETQTISLTLSAVNDDGSFSGDTSGSGAEGDSLHHRHPRLHRQQRRRLHTNFTVSSAATNGTASINATTGAWSYEPDADFNGSDSFTVTVTDDDGHEETQTISLTLSAVNDDGSFSGDTSGSGAEGASITGTLAFTDSKDGASTPNFTVSSAATNGTASINATTGAWSYEPDTDFNGSDSFIVTVTDDDGHEETQTISLTLSAVNDDGSFSGDTSGSGAEGASITGTLAFTDSKDGDSTPNFTVSSAATNGTASINATTGAWSYEPDTDFNGSDSFTVTVTDDDGHEETQTISLTLSADAPDDGSFSGDTSGSFR